MPERALGDPKGSSPTGDLFCEVLFVIKIKNMKKFIKPFVLGIGSIILGFVLAGLFIVDIGINSKFFIKRDFNQAFQYRTAGDCVSFTDCLYRDVEKWNSTCEKEKAYDAEPIRNFTIQNISHKFGSDRAFLQVELTRNYEGKDDVYSINYEMKKVGLKWKINQEKK